MATRSKLAGYVTRAVSKMSKSDRFFSSIFLIGIVGAALLISHGCLKPSDGATVFAGLLAAAVVWWQGYLIKRQMQLQAMLDLLKEWDSPEMLAQRRSAWNNQNEVDKDNIEGVLEFLERVSTLEKNGYISVDLIWDTLGWYVSRYAHYGSRAITELRSYWTPQDPDPTLYQHLARLREALLELDIDKRNAQKGKGQPRLEMDAVIAELDATKQNFIRLEKGAMSASPCPRVLAELRPSNVHKGGVGVFAVPSIMKAQKVADGICEQDYQDLIPWRSVASCDADVRKKIMDFCIGTPDGFIPPENLDFNKLSIEWYLNHSCEGNIGFDEEGNFVAIKSVAEGEELTYDYGLAESNPNFILDCTCGSTSCRKKITGNDWKDRSFQAKHGTHMLPRLRSAL